MVAREAFRVMQQQGVGGSMVFVASKNGLIGSKNASVYGAAKAAEINLARCLAEEGGVHGIRVNTVCPDAVLRGSAIWSSDWKEARAKSMGINTNQLEEAYRQRNTLKASIYPEDIAEAIAFFASDRSAKTTGSVLTVDGGVTAAYVR
jgi:NAD(P)-dependent dehydrogenase (short-subunit alcohol dehydrogenase family)